MNVSSIGNVINDKTRTSSFGSLYVLKQLTGEQSFEQQLLDLLKNNPQMIAQEQIANGERLDVRV